MMFNILFKTLRTFGEKGGDFANYLASPTQPSVPPVTNEILTLNLNDLAQKIRRRELSSEQVVRAYINRMRTVQPYLNAIVDERYDDAIKDAKAIDNFLKTTDMTEEELAQKKPFLGIPFTLKDSIQCCGMRWTSGCVARKDIISDEDAPVVKNYRKAGAIPVALTNVPELLLWFATSNQAFGTTNNPHDLTRVPGGSSGGEAALVAASGTPLSICSDIGGSIRMPAFYCGLFGHKPTQNVIDYRGTFPHVKDGLEDLFSFGPIARYVDDLIPAVKVMAGENIKLLIDFDKPVDLKKIRIFYIDQNQDCMSTGVEPYISESIRKAVQHMSEKYQVPVEKAHLRYLKHIPMWYSLLFSNNQEVSTLITDNKYKINPFVELAKSVVGQSEFSPSALMAAAAQTTTQATYNPKTSPEVYAKVLESLQKARKEFNSLLGDDGILFYPTMPRTAPTHYASLFEFTNVCFPMVMNYLNAPTTQVPSGVKDGLPYGFQVSASHHNDRLTLAAAKELEQFFGGWINPCEVKLSSSSTTDSIAAGISEPLATSNNNNSTAPVKKRPELVASF